jgi:hypothetical protein
MLTETAHKWTIRLESDDRGVPKELHPRSTMVLYADFSVIIDISFIQPSLLVS